MPYQNWEILVSFAFYFGAKIICFTFRMFRQDVLTSIPERNEIEEPQLKWVTKKKHEVLKAKYKCLKKLFQIYDATAIIGVIPEPTTEYADDTNTRRRLKRSHRTKTDAYAGTTETFYSGEPEEVYNTVSLAQFETCHLEKKQSCSTQIESSKHENLSIQSHASKSEISNSDTNTDFSDKTTESCVNCHAMSQHLPQHLPPHIVPYLMGGRRKLTRFQSFVHRIFGIRQDAFILPNDDVYATSDSYQERRRRRGLRFRRLRRAKKIKSDSNINDMKGSAILSYVQSVQKSCLMDTTPRQCPIVGCKMVSYGIINYNDHLNLCHFKDRKYVCHYCHEGFETVHEKTIHENEHIGLNKLGANLNLSRQKIASNCDTQTEPEAIPNEKLKKIVSFFDRIAVEDVGKRNSESNLKDGCSVCVSENSSEKRTVSCMNIGKCQCESSNTHTSTSQQYGIPVSCHIGQNLQYRRRLSLHEDSKRRNSYKFNKFHSCAGIINPQRCPALSASEDRRNRDLVSEDGRLNVRSIDSPSMTETNYSTVTPCISETKLASRKSSESLTCDPSTNIVYCTSMDSVKKGSVVESLVQKFRKYKWEPGTKVIHV